MLLSTCKIKELIVYLQIVIEKEYKMKEKKMHVGRPTSKSVKDQKEAIIYG